MVEVDKFLDKNLEHVGKALQKSERAYTVRAEAALESGADLAFKIDVCRPDLWIPVVPAEIVPGYSAIFPEILLYDTFCKR